MKHVKYFLVGLAGLSALSIGVTLIILLIKFYIAGLSILGVLFTYAFGRSMYEDYKTKNP